MPSTSAKQHNFMQAIAHSPKFAKKAGVPQSVGKDFAAADKGKKFVRGGINKQDTRHGKIDMPFNKLNRFAGMKAGGMMKKGRRFNEGDRVYAEDAGITGRGDEKVEDQYRDSTNEGADSYAEPQKSANRSEGPQGKLEELKIPNRSRPAAAPARAAAAETKPAAENKPAASSKFNSTPGGAATGMTRSKREAAKPAETKPAAAPARSTGAQTREQRLDSMTRSEREAVVPSRLSRFYDSMFKKNNMKKGGMTKRFAQGGMMKESKAMVGKEMAFMKKKGAPKSMIKHEAAEMGAMKKGGMAKYAKGGGIESRGKTKGTIVRMASGGVVKFAKGGGIESRGKTKGTMIKMKGC